MTYSEVERWKDTSGTSSVTIRQKARYVDVDKYRLRNLLERVPEQEDSERVRLQSENAWPIYIPFPQAVPAHPVIDSANCIHFKNGKCGSAKELSTGAITSTTKTSSDRRGRCGGDRDRIQALLIGKEQSNPKIAGYGEYGYGKYKDVIDSRSSNGWSPPGPTGGEPKRPSDGRVPQKIVFIQCVGSRQRQRGLPFENLYVYRQAYDALSAQGIMTVRPSLYMDIRSGGKQYDEFVRRHRTGRCDPSSRPRFEDYRRRDRR